MIFFVDCEMCKFNGLFEFQILLEFTHLCMVKVLERLKGM